MSQRYFLVGGAGFIGSHFTDKLLGMGHAVTLFDNFSSGQEWHYSQHKANPLLRVERGDVKDLPALTRAMGGHDTVIHLASNPDIAKAITEPDIDFREGTALTQNVVEAMRLSGAKTILYASGSGVYGDLGLTEAGENHAPLLPISTYGASKLAGEALIASYCYMFDIRGYAFRFGNVVGPRQTHGVGFDFVRRLKEDPSRLRILGDGTQSKSYISVQDVLAAVLLAPQVCKKAFDFFNVATGDYITVTEIAELSLECLKLPKAGTRLEYTGGNRGWKGDVPVVRLSTDKIQALGWKCQRSSREALRAAMYSMIEELREGSKPQAATPPEVTHDYHA